MFNLKKSVLVSISLMSMGASMGANAATANATVQWSGTVPSSNATQALVITGLASDTSALKGFLSPEGDGTFESDSIVLEAHVNDAANANEPTVGALIAANWTLSAASVSFDGYTNDAATVQVMIDGVNVAVGEVVSEKESISTIIKQTESLPQSEVSGATVQASVTVMADVV